MRRNSIVSLLKRFSIVVFFSAIVAVIHLLFVFNPSFAEWYNNTIGSFFRLLSERMTSRIPFSFAEYIFLLLPLVLICIVYLLIRGHGTAVSKVVNAAFLVFVIACSIYASFVLTFAAGYRAPSIESKLNTGSDRITKEQLSGAARYLTDELNEVSRDIGFSNEKISEMPFTSSALFKELNNAYMSLDNPYIGSSSFASYPKTIALSGPMTYTHISGMYSFFTGEANVNVNYPGFIIPFTAAHEMSHQQGVARENEANFTAFLICESSSDAYIRYSAYLNMFEFVADDLYDADPDEYFAVYSILNNDVKNELQNYSDFFEKYRNSSISAVSNKMNDIYLTAQGTDGVVSYGKVTELFVALLVDREILTKS